LISIMVPICSSTPTMSFFSIESNVKDYSLEIEAKVNQWIPPIHNSLNLTPFERPTVWREEDQKKKETI
ncbi:MAG: hypothetical protein O3B25_09075, partial [Verrucomicrobia bacterium]|nr:hypothetical protein [Verrucomicrobiota bacterium]